KTLTLLRHAKSGWDDPVARDFDRPLNPKGQRAAAMMGRYLKAEGLEFDHVLASPAARVVETLAQVATGYGSELAPHWDQRLYLAS
ncbi:SixA phosphatase family protein, partial [Salmonella enterica]|uniref:SixA phosphatase family protein n=2 Tax=Pseudomonadota TaxID=1224 RepID=UPI0032B5179B